MGGVGLFVLALIAGVVGFGVVVMALVLVVLGRSTDAARAIKKALDDDDTNT